VAYDSYTQVNKVIGVDANGVTGTIIGAEFSASGKAVKSFDGTDATLVTKDDEDLIGSQITVLAFYNDLVATTTLTVVDNEGKGSSVSVYNNVDAKALVVAKPENAVAIVDADMNSKGQVVLSFLASEAGEYEVQTIVTFEDANKAKHYVTSIDTVTVGAGAGTYDDIVVMSIGANKIVVNSEVKVIDAAPVVENNRTFVPFRALAEAFGATVAYDEATQSVTAELDGTTVVMTIGSAEYTVNGEVKTADVAPFINGSRTMVPVRFVAEAFGINVTPVYGENGATVDVLFAK
ncbi:MAG: copper amine oxidase N-terminal domain-containing protein, partial [Peptococcaceae bacterium]|nr:copper amine oxidase N-terminal domain-containing protein [Peptococcaceae bacterium]